MIRRLAAGDEPLLQEVCRRFKQRVPSDDEAAAFLAGGCAVGFVAVEEDEPVGFAYGYVLPRVDGTSGVFVTSSRWRRRRAARASDVRSSVS